MADEPRTPGAPLELAQDSADNVGSETVQHDYFDFDEVLEHVLPDGASKVRYRKLNEGGKRKYLNTVNREIRLDRKSGDAAVKTEPGTERKVLIEAAVIGWNLVRGGKPIAFSEANLREFLTKSDPVVIDGLEKAIRLANPWLLSDMTVEQIDKEIADLYEMREKVEAEEEGKESSNA